VADSVRTRNSNRRSPSARSGDSDAGAATGTDAQRSKVYSAEQLVHRIFDRAVDYPTVDLVGSRITLPAERKFASLQSVQAYVDAVLSLGWVLERWPRAVAPVAVRERAGAGSAHYERSGSVIAVPGTSHGDRWALRELVVLHEIAHHLESDDTSPHHGPGYVGRLLDLVDGVIGPEAALLLRVTFAENGVRMS
jgi:putative metallohydrolase (TIGR04338 family)